MAKALKILVIRFSSIGDIVLTTPVFRCLKNQLEACEIHFLTKKKFASLQSANPHIDKIHAFDNNRKELIKELKNEHFDCVIDLHNNQRSWLFSVLLGVKKIHRFSKLNLEKWLLVHLKLDLMPEVHIVDRYLQTVSFLGVRNDGRGLDFFIPEDVMPLPDDIASLLKEPFVAFSIGGQHQTKRLPFEKLVKICSDIKSRVVLLGGTKEQEEAQRIVGEAGSSVLNACGRLNLFQSACLIRHAQVVISHDTGLMHIASAFSKPMVSVWGNTVPELGMYPYYPSESNIEGLIAEVKGLSCRPCSKIGYKKCPKGHFHCMNKIDDKAVVSFVNSHISGNGDF